MAEVLLTTGQVAEKLGLTDRRVRQMVTSGAIKARKVGYYNLIDERELARIVKSRALAEAKAG